MPIGKMPTTTPSSGSGAGARTVFRPPWVKGEDGKDVKPATWRRPSAAKPAETVEEKPEEKAKPEPAVTKKEPVATKKEPVATKKESVTEKKEETAPVKKSTVKTQQSTTKEPPKKPTENGKPETKKEEATPKKEVSAKLQSREIKVPIMTEHKKITPPLAKVNLKPVEKKHKEEKSILDEPEPAIKVNLKPVEVKEKDEKKTPEEKRVFDKPKAMLRKVDTPMKKELSRDDSQDIGSKFIRPVLKKVPKVDDTFKEIEKSKVPTVELKRTETIRKEKESPKRIEVSLSRTVMNKKEPEKPKSTKKLEPVKASCEYISAPIV